MLRAADERKFQPGCVIFDSWHSSIDNLKLIRSLKWHWCTCLKSNRLVDPDHSHNHPVSAIDIPPEGRVVLLRQYGLSRCSGLIIPTETLNTGLWISLMHQNPTGNPFKGLGWNIDEYRRGIKQCCGIEKCLGRKEVVSEAIFFCRCSLFFASKLIALILVPAGTRIETINSSIGVLTFHRFTDLLIPSFFTEIYDGCSSLIPDSTA